MIDFHLHTSRDHDYVKYNEKQLVDELHKKGFKTASITLHENVYYNKDIFDYAKSKGILLIRGAETKIEGKEVLIYNISEDERKRLRTFNDLKKMKREKDILVIAPHPFYPDKKALNEELIKHIDLFDAIEYCYFYHRFFNPFNKKAVRVANEFSKPLIANSDAHFLWQIGYNYSIVEGDNIKEVFHNIRKGNIKIYTKPVGLSKMLKVLYYNFIY